VAWRLGGVGRSTDTSERVDGLMRSDQPGSAALGRIAGRKGEIAAACWQKEAWRGV